MKDKLTMISIRSPALAERLERELILASKDQKPAIYRMIDIYSKIASWEK